MKLRNSLPSALAAIVLASAMAPESSAQCQIGERQKIVSPNGAASENFGQALALDSGIAAVGVEKDDTMGFAAGSVMVFRESGGTFSFSEELFDSGAMPGDRFGAAVAIDAEFLAVGEPGDDTLTPGAGAVSVFRDLGGSYFQESVVYPSNPQILSGFGSSLAIQGELLAVGAPEADGQETDAGAVYLFRYDYKMQMWMEDTILFASDGVTSDEFGRSIALDGDRLIVGSASHNGDRGAAYVYEYDLFQNAWIETKLEATDGVSGDFFGNDVDIDGNRLVVGAFRATVLANDEGAAYIYEHDGAQWNETEKIHALVLEDFMHFATQVALDGDTVVATAPQSSGGASYVFRFGHENRLAPSDVVLSDQFGNSLALDEDLALVGSPLDDDSAFNGGAAYFFDLPQLVLEASDDAVESGDPLGFSVCGGEALGPAMIALVTIAGIPTFSPVFVGSFDATGVLNLGPFPVPEGLEGIDASFQAFGMAASGIADGSNVEDIEFQ